MAETKVTNIVVDELSKFGFKSNGRYVNYSKQLKESDKVFVVPGATFEAELYVADSGKEYLNKVLKTASPAKMEKPKVSVKAQEPKETKKDEAMTRGDWDSRDSRISRAGVIQAAIQAVGGEFDEAVILADKMLAYVRTEDK